MTTWTLTRRGLLARSSTSIWAQGLLSNLSFTTLPSGSTPATAASMAPYSTALPRCYTSHLPATPAPLLRPASVAATRRACNRSHSRWCRTFASAAEVLPGAEPTVTAAFASSSSSSSRPNGSAPSSSPSSGSSGGGGSKRSSSSRASSTSALSAKPPKSELLSIKGVGPRYENLLRQRGVSCVRALQEKLHLQLRGDEAALQCFLEQEVGIRNKQHCRWVLEHIRSLEWAPPRPRITLAVEGNIGAGKSTFLNMLSRPDLLLRGESLLGGGHLEVQDVVEVVPEPVDEWQAAPSRQVGPDGAPLHTFNLLEKFYTDPRRYAYTFQSYVLMTRIRKERLTREGAAPLRVLERSIFSDRMVFVRAMHEAGSMEDWELQMYDEWFSQQLRSDRQLAPSGFVYLQTQPSTCVQRMMRRDRSEEKSVSESYLEKLHQHHEDWLGGALPLREGASFTRLEEALYRTTTQLQHGGPSTARRGDSALHAAMDSSGRVQAFLPHADQLLGARVPQQPDSISGKVVFLRPGGGGSNKEEELLDALNGVPALILDHDHDSLHDLDAQRWQARQVTDFFEYVKALKELQGPEPRAKAAAPAPTDSAALLAKIEAIEKMLLSQAEAQTLRTSDAVEMLREVQAQMDGARAAYQYQ